MRDFVQCEWPLPGLERQNGVFETASLGNEGRRYTITKEGRLVRHTSEEVLGYRGPSFTEDVELPIHGDVHLTSRGQAVGEPRLVIVVRFRNGLVQWARLLAEVGPLHQLLSRACKHLPSDYRPWGEVEREASEAPQGWWPDCSSSCRHFLKLKDAGDQLISCDWGVCINPKSHRYGLLTFEHQGCPAYEFEDDDQPGQSA